MLTKDIGRFGRNSRTETLDIVSNLEKRSKRQFSACMRPLWLLLLSVSALLAGEGQELIGQLAPDWKFDHWQNSRPLQLKDLRGKVVLIRWWTAPECRYCAASAPALNEFYREYRKRGLEIIGAYHHKSDEPLAPKEIARQAREFGFKFPVAIDTDWSTVNRWWLDGHEREFTSVSFLIDRRGVIRYIHPGGQYVKGEPDFAKLESAIETLLAEK